jgi:hypothetical protein
MNKMVKRAKNLNKVVDIMQDKQYKSFNANEYILVKLNPEGETLLQASGYPSHPNEQGYRKFPLWKFMELFGGDNLSQASEPLFDMNVLIAEEDLVEVQ